MKGPDFFRLTGRVGLIQLLLLFTLQTAFADSATWNLDPTSGDWNTATNWTPNTVPNGPSDVATLAVSNQTAISLSANTIVDSIVFSPGASAFSIFAKPQFMLTISGSGIMNESSGTQDFVAAAGALVAGEIAISFENGATAGDNTRFTAEGATAMEQSGGGIFFYDASSAGSGDFIINGAAVINGGSSSNGRVSFGVNSTAANATFTANASTAPGPQPGGVIQFGDNSTAANATIISNGAGMADTRPGVTAFDNASTAGNADLIAYGGVPGAEGGVILFVTDSAGGVARVTVFGNGNLDISGHNLPGVTVGSIEGDGLISLGANNLTVGSNNLRTTFSGVIQDGGTDGGAGGSLTKIGNGKLTLSGANTYTGGTTINAGSAGTLFVTNRRGSGTGSGAVQVNVGKLGGTGKISGSVTVGTGSGTGAFLTPGTVTAIPSTLTIQKKLTFNADGTFHFGFKSSNITADKIIARGVTIGSGALIFFDHVDAGTFPLGTVFTAIDNTAATPIAGTFANLPDGATFTIDNITFQADYQGGDGNNFTLTVVP